MGNQGNIQHNNNKNNNNNYKNKNNQSKIVACDEEYKIAFDGYIRTGKTSIIRKYIEGKNHEFSNKGIHLREYGLYELVVSIEGKSVRIKIFDCPVKETFGSAIEFIGRRIDIFIFVYDIADKATFVTVKKQFSLLKERFEEKDALLILVGNKIDLPKREVFRDIAEDFAQENKMTFIETSIITGDGIKKLFDLITNNLIQRTLGIYPPHSIKEKNKICENNLGNDDKPKPSDISNFIGKQKNNSDTPQENYEKLYNEEKSKNAELEQKIAKLQNVIDYLENQLNNEKEKNFKLSSSKENNTNGEEDQKKIIRLYDEILDKENEIKKLKAKIEKFPFKLAENEDLMSIIIAKEDKSILYSIICKNTDKFIKLEEKFYEEFSELGKVENSFYINDNKIKKYQTLDENGIKNNDIIILR